MPEQIYIGNFSKGLKNDRLPFNIDNDSFPTLYNFYAWRGRVKRKRGTQTLGRLNIQVESVLDAAPPKVWQQGQMTLVASEINLFTFLGLSFSGQAIVKGSIDFFIGVDEYTEPSPPDGTLLKNGVADPNSLIDYATGDVFIQGGGASVMIGTFSYYPSLPVMGLRDFVASQIATLYPLLLAFDTKYSYQISGSTFYNTTYYVNGNPFTWSGEDYQQFWTVNYSGALWATNNKPGLHILSGTYVIASGSSGTKNITFNFKLSGSNYTDLVDGDIIWFNEWIAGGVTLNGITGEITDDSDAINGNYVVTFIDAQTVSGTGIIQVLTNSIPTGISTQQDGIKYYTGDPTSATGLPTGTNKGWVNFSPPLTGQQPPGGVSIDNRTSAVYYLVGALGIIPFKDRLLFLSPYIQSSSGAAIQLFDTILWSWNGTPYYTVDDANNTPTPFLVPENQTANIKAYYVDQTGLGGYLPAGISQPIKTFSNNEDALIVGFGGDGRKTRFMYTSNDLQPFLFFNINSELPSSATFSAITLDRGVLDIGQYGLALTDQQSSQRVDIDIPNEIFQIRALNNGAERVNSFRDFLNEWIYFAYPVQNSPWKFPTQTLLFNYRDNTWAIFYENFTTHGRYRRQTKRTWLTTGFASWNVWKEPWIAGSASPLFPQSIAGNPQGYVLIVGEGTGEAPSGYISAISNNGGFTQITSYNHCVTANNTILRTGDYLYLTDALGIYNTVITGITKASQAVITTTNTFAIGQFVYISDVSGMTEINNKYYEIINASATTITLNLDTTNFSTYTTGGTASEQFNNFIVLVTETIDANNFLLDLPFPSNSTYTGSGQFTRLSMPLMQTKQFPVYWNEGRQTRLGTQKYLLDRTTNGQVTLNIYLSEDDSNIWNSLDVNDNQIYTQLLYTCPEAINIGLTPANYNLQNPIAPISGSGQIWHRINTSLQGDTVQIGITLSDAQMRDLNICTQDIVLQGIQLTVDRGPHLS